MSQPTIHDCLNAAAKAAGVPVEAMLGTQMYRSLSRYRQIGMYLAYTLTFRSSAEVGRVFKRDHTTILYATQRVREKLPHDAGLQAMMHDVRAFLPKREVVA